MQRVAGESTRFFYREIVAQGFDWALRGVVSDPNAAQLMLAVKTGIEADRFYAHCKEKCQPPIRKRFSF